LRLFIHRSLFRNFEANPAAAELGCSAFKRANKLTLLVISTANLELVIQTPAELLAYVDKMPPADRAEVSPDWLARVRVTAEGDPWALGFAVRKKDSGVVVGSCGFKGPPDSEGAVEVAYGIDPAHRGCGFATESAEALATFAFNSGRVRTVRGHTKPDNAASARVLAKCGFKYVGDVVDPEDGLVCRWEMEREPVLA
jgi:[ribosomal protein S5]-alanine N-acetyltransferase